ncbi:MAG: hypothetical protein GY754_44645 [bacterium]|nr:hypothetical protein [bacterium]
MSNEKNEKNGQNGWCCGEMGDMKDMGSCRDWFKKWSSEKGENKNEDKKEGSSCFSHMEKTAARMMKNCSCMAKEK